MDLLIKYQTFVLNIWQDRSVVKENYNLIILRLNKDNWILLMIYDKCAHEKKKWKNKTGKRFFRVLHFV